MSDTVYPEGWFPVATAAEVRSKPVRRKLCGVPLVLYRTADGKVAALHDRCPHRSAPLSKGRVLQDEIECPYHGWRFDRAGKCTAIPFHDGELPRRFIPAVPVEERHGLIFARHGRGNVDIYDPFWQGEGRTLRRIIPTFARTSLINVVENVLDPTHTAFTHNTLMRGMSGNRKEVDIRLFEQDGMLHLIFTGERRQDGLISFSETNRTASETHIARPGIVEVVYWHDNKINLVTSVYFSPVDENETRGFILLTTPFKYGLSYLKAALFLPMFRMIIRQDQDILAASYENWKAFGRQQNAVSPLDYMRPNLEALLAGQEPPVAREPLQFKLRL